MTTTDPTKLSQKQLDEAAPKALVFLRGMGLNPGIRDLFNKNGYSDAEHAKGWKLVFAASGAVFKP